MKSFQNYNFKLKSVKTYDTLYKYFEKIYNHPLTADEKSVLEKSVRVEIFQKKQIVFSSGESGTKHYLIEKGLLRLFVIDQDGKEFNILFASENQWIGDLSSPAPTSFFLDAVEKTTVYSFSDESFRALTSNLNSVTELIKKSYIFLQKRFVSILSKTAEENYDELCRTIHCCFGGYLNTIFRPILA